MAVFTPSKPRSVQKSTRLMKLNRPIVHGRDLTASLLVGELVTA
jgi:hypothetical protein